jgi:hypothetical protein
MDNLPVSNIVLREILEKSNASTGMYIQKVYKDSLREFISIFSNIYYIDKDNNPIKIKCFHGNQERVIAKTTLGDNITLPVITITESSTSNNDERRKYSKLLVHEKYWDKDKNRAIRILSLAPRPVDITYEINIWTKYKQDLDQIRESIFTMFNPDLEIKTNKSYYTKAFLVDESDISQVEVSDLQDRVLRKKLSVNLETYIPNPRFLYTSTGKIEEFNFEVEIEANPSIVQIFNK